MIKFIITLLIGAAGLLGLVFLAVDEHWLEGLPSFLYQTTFFLFFSTAVIYSYLYKLNKPEIFVQMYLLSMSVKLMGYGVYIYFMITGDALGTFSNVIFFMLTYFVFTTLEIVFLYRKINTKHTG